jgi:hypothetical protein
MSAFEEFPRDNPPLADQPYGEAMAGTLRRRSHAMAKEPRSIPFASAKMASL